MEFDNVVCNCTMVWASVLPAPPCGMHSDPLWPMYEAAYWRYVDYMEQAGPLEFDFPYDPAPPCEPYQPRRPR